MSKIEVLYILSGLVTCIGFVVCIRNLWKFSYLSVSFFSWLIWLGAEILNFFTCLSETQHSHLYELTFSAITTLATIGVVVTAGIKKLFGKIVWLDGVIVFLLTIAAFVWYFDKNNIHANSIVLSAIGVGYLATAWGVMTGTLREKSNSWFIICVGGLMTLFAQFNDPGVHSVNIHFALVATIGEGGVFLIITIKNKYFQSRP
jgi:hypothetical protein